jgi:hypothetical protein
MPFRPAVLRTVFVARVRTREVVQELLRFGFSQAEIVAGTGRSKATIAYHVRNLGHAPDERFNRRYDWAEVQRYHDAGHGGRACMRHFGFASSTWTDAVRRGALVPRPQAMPVEELLRGRRHRGHVKRRLIKLGLKEDRCEVCGISGWLGRPLSLALHHVNGDGEDNRLENLQLLCPNCHSQTENFAGRKRRWTAGGPQRASPPPDGALVCEVVEAPPVRPGECRPCSSSRVGSDRT